MPGHFGHRPPANPALRTSLTLLSGPAGVCYPRHHPGAPATIQSFLMGSRTQGATEAPGARELRQVANPGPPGPTSQGGIRTRGSKASPPELPVFPAAASHKSQQVISKLRRNAGAPWPGGSFSRTNITLVLVSGCRIQGNPQLSPQHAPTSNGFF